MSMTIIFGLIHLIIKRESTAASRRELSVFQDPGIFRICLPKNRFTIFFARIYPKKSIWDAEKSDKNRFCLVKAVPL